MYRHKLAHFCGQEHFFVLPKFEQRLSMDIKLIKRMTGYIKKSHTAMFIGQTGCGKTHLVLELIENQYNNHFDYIFIICQTLRGNETDHAKEWIKNDGNVWLVDPKDNLYQWIQKLSEFLRFLEVLFIIDDIFTNESLDKRRQPLLELSVSGRHRGHYLWLLTHLILPYQKI